MRTSPVWAAPFCSALLACSSGTPSTPSTGPFPIAKAGCPYYISGLSRHVVDPAAVKLEARVPVGQIPNVGIAAACGSWAGPFVFSSTDITVLSVDQLPGFGGGPGPGGLLVASQPGQAQLFLEFEGDDERRHRTSLGYCANEGSGYCTDPRPIDVVTVVQQ
jgi:hypothetical protein